MTPSSQTRDLRTDGFLFDDDYLHSANPDIAEQYLWPVPVFRRMREDTRANVGSTTIRPGDVLEFCGGAYEEYLLVVAILPETTFESAHKVKQNSGRLLLYSSNAECYRVFDTRSFTERREQFLRHPSGDYAVHEDSVELVEVGSAMPADVSWPPKPAFSDDGPSDRVKEKYPHSNPPQSIQPQRAIPDDPTAIDDLLSEIHQGDATDVLSDFPTNSVHAWVTSPPYFQQRDYNADGQLGREESINNYLESLMSTVNQLMRVVRDDGLGWIILDDSYEDGSLAGVPERLHQELDKEGYDILHHSPWVKPNPKPESVSSRYSHAHEHVLCITSSSGSHFFNKQAADNPKDIFDTPVGSTDTDHDAVFPVELPKRLIRSSVPEKVCADCSAPYEQVYEVTDIRDLPDGRPQAERALELAEKHNLSDEHLRAARAVGLGHTGQAKRTQDGTGKNTTEVEQLASEAEDALGSYVREFTQAKKHPTGFEKACDCDTTETAPGIVIDPFAGSGTTCVAAKDLRRRWAGVELNPDYVAAAQSRLGITVSDPDRLTTDSQQTLTSF